MYEVLSRHRKAFVCVDVANGPHVLRLSGCLLEVKPEFITLSQYDDVGVKTCEMSVPMRVVIGLYVGHRDEVELRLRAAYGAGSGEDKTYVS